MNSIFDSSEFKVYADRWQRRLIELDRRRRYYDGSIYSPMYRHLQSSSEYGMLWPSLYQGIKPLYLPLARAVDVDAGIIPNNWQLAEDSDIFAEAVADVFAWSSWDTDGFLFVHYGAEFGCVGLKIVDDRKQKRIIIQAVKPTSYLLIETGAYDPSPATAIAIETKLDDAGSEFEYSEVITAETIRTFSNGVPTGFDGRENEYQNELGFVPYVEVEHIKTGELYGESTYQKAIPLLDEVNQLASYFADIIGKHAEPQWIAIGAEASDLVKSGDNVWFMPSGSEVKPLVPNVDFDGILNFIKEIRDQVVGALPELAFDDIKRKDQIATATLELQLMELVLKIKRIRPNYDQGLADALRLAGRAGSTMQLPGIAVLDSEQLSFDANRDVLPLDRQTAIALELQEISLEQMKGVAGGINA